ncbi:MAG: sodium/proton-translocating pyrophosphatase, partial [Salinivirgaceae bacterium]|nr:sodium/proton-translocating pyrophosphatase [Salinivirgaceae bacterium]
MENLIYVVLAASVVALSFAYIFFRQMMKESEGTELMQQIAAHVRKGAMAYLKQQYKVVIIVFVVLAVLF